jgi:hypothetical protein
MDDAFAASPLALLDACSSLHLITDAVYQDDALCLALTCRALRDVLWARFPSLPAGDLFAGRRQGVWGARPLAGEAPRTRDPFAGASEAELRAAAGALPAGVQAKLDEALGGNGVFIACTLPFEPAAPLGAAEQRALGAALRLGAGPLPLTFLSLDRTGLTGDGAAMVFGAIKARGCPGLKTVQLSDNPELGELGLLAVLAAAVVAFPALERIFIHVCAVGNEGFEALAAALPNLPTVTDIYACGNDCGDGGALALAVALPAARALKTLFMQNNGATVGAEAAAALL